MPVRCHVVVSLMNENTFFLQPVRQMHSRILTLRKRRLVCTHSVDHRLWSHFDVHHGSSQDMTCIVRLDLQLIIHLPAAQQKQLDSLSKETGSWCRNDWQMDSCKNHITTAPGRFDAGSKVPLSSCSPWSFARWRSWFLPFCQRWSSESPPAKWDRWPWSDGSCRWVHRSPPSHSWRAERHSGPSGNG